VPAKKLVLTYVDSLRTDMLERAVAEGRAPTFGALIERGTFVPDCVSSFPSVTPVACAEMVCGSGAEEHWISGMNWYHRLERRYVEYGSSLEATRAFGIFRTLYDLVYNLNLAHLNPGIATLFEQLDDAGLRTACTPFLVYRGRHRHQVSLEGLLRRAVDATRLKFRHHTWGPAELFYGDLYASSEVPCKPSSIPGSRDGYSACCAAELAKGDGFDFLLFSLPDNDNYSHRHGPEASVESIAKADHCFAKLLEAAGGLDDFLDEHALILLADHAQTPVHRGLPLAELLGRRWSVLRPSDDRPERAQLAVSPTGRAAHVYLLPCEEDRADAEEVARALGEIEGIDLVCRLEGPGGMPLPRKEPGPPDGEATAVVERGGHQLRFRPGNDVADRRGRHWDLEGDMTILEARVEDGRLLCEAYPDPLHPLPLLRLRGGRLGRRHPRRRRQPRLAAGRRLARPAALRRLRAGRPRRTGAVGSARRRSDRPRALRPMKRTLAALAVGSLFLLGPAAAAAEIGAAQATRIADRDPKVVEQRESVAALTHHANEVDGSWEVGYFDGDDQVALVLVDPHTGEVRESWTGHQIAWKMARGYSGAFGHELNAPYVFLPLCAIFLLGLVDWRRLGRLANLDLVALLGFGASHFFFNRAEIGVSVPLQYVPLAYLFARALWIGLRGRGEGLRPVWPAAWLLVAALFLLGFRVGLNVTDSGVIDVGYASVAGADRVVHGEPIYDNFPDDVSQGDTYGPLNYYAYVPFERIWPWSGSWDDLPAAHGAAVFFDLATFALLILLGRRIRPGPEGSKLAATLGFGWAAYPYTAYALLSNSNDTLVAMLLLATLLALARPAGRGAMAALATFAKFAPVVLVPMLATYKPPGARPRSPRPHTFLVFGLAFAVTSALVMLWPAIDPGISTFYDRTLAYQTGRDSPFSVWGQVPSLEPLRIAILACVALLSLLFAVRPKRKNLVQVAALGAALLIGLQLTMHHWFYLYIVWFYPLLFIALASLEGEPDTPPNGLYFFGSGSTASRPLSTEKVE
jgi:predicted AlkP superfamily pyrophosphatase or phosphodiesterase